MTCALIDLSQNTIDSVLKAKNKMLGKSLILAVSTAINFVITLLLVPRMGAMGAVIGSCFSLVFGYGVALNVYYHKVIHINMFTFYKKTYATILLATIAGMAVGFGIAYVNPLGGWLGFLAEAAVYVVIFAVLMYFVGLNKGEKSMIKGKIRKIFHK